MIKNNDKLVCKIYNGENTIERIYKGTDKVYEFLPIGYKECKYIESTGTQYIDLEIKGNQNSKVDFQFSVTKKINSRGIFGFYGANGNSYYIYSGGAGVFQIGYQKWSNTNISIVENTKYIIKNDKNIISINDYNYSLPEATTFETSDNLLLFTIGGGNYAGLPIKLYYFKLYESDKLIRDLIPAIDSTRRPCLYDLVSKTTFYNVGTGTFGYELK